jgi:nitrogen fixation protein NifQ
MRDLRELLLANRNGRHDSEIWLADILIAGCLGDDHLWQDLGLWNRADLSQLMHQNFRSLALRNDKDMKWKKFLYKQLCETEGIYTCRAPSCAVCADYANCFGPED